MLRALLAEPIVPALVLLFSIALAAVALFSWFRPRAPAARLREHFGTEYDFVMQRYGRIRGRRALTQRLQRGERLRLRPLSPEQRADFVSAWRHVEEHFVETPLAAVGKAQELVHELMHARGYPPADFEQSVANLSVHHADVVHHYRAARAADESARIGSAGARELTEAIEHWRQLFAALLGAESRGSKQGGSPDEPQRAAFLST